MDNETIIQRGLDLLNVMTLDTAAVWAVLDDDQRAQIDAMLQQLETLAEAAQHVDDVEQAIAQLVAIAAGVIQMIESTPELTAMFIPEAERGGTPPTLGIRKVDLGDSENERQAQVHRFIPQVINNVTLIRKDGPAKTAPKERQRS